MLALYLSAVLFIVVFLDLPLPYLLVGFIPMALTIYLTQDRNQATKAILFKLIMITGIFINLIYPYSLLPAKLTYLNGAYQKAHIQTIEKLLADQSDYVAGIELIYTKTQPIAGMRHLMGPAIDYLYKPTPELKSVMLASLYEDPNASIQSVISAFSHSSVKFYVNNYRIRALPPKIKNYLNSQYAHWWGSIYLYAPVIAKGKQIVAIKFPGKYRVESMNPIIINEQVYYNHDVITLSKGLVSSTAQQDYRLKLIPGIETPNPAFQQDDWDKIMF
jgi:hypothetical protein